MSYEKLKKSAIAAIPNAYAPYSNFRVGAAIESKNGKIFCGVNVENASYGCVICAERVALSSAILAGEREFKALCIATEGKILTPPCGICRQSLSEFGLFLKVIIVSTSGLEKEYILKDLLPEPFGRNNLGK